VDALAIFDGPISRDLAFGSASRDAGTPGSRAQAADRSNVKGQRLVLAAATASSMLTRSLRI